MQRNLDIQILCEIFSILCSESNCNLAGMQGLIELELLLLWLLRRICWPSSPSDATQRRNRSWLEKVLLLMLLRLDWVLVASRQLLRLSYVSEKVLTRAKPAINVLSVVVGELV